MEKDVKEQLETQQKAGQHAPAVVESIKARLMQQPGGLILLDGLDEVSAANQHRTHLLQAIQAFVAALPEYTRFIVTARPYAYTDPQWRLADFTAFFLTPFDKDQRRRFIEGWYDAGRMHFGLREADLKQQIPDLLDRVENQRHLRELGERPLLLTLISTLHASGGRLPEDRVQLYADSVELLLYRWRREVFRGSDGQPLRLDERKLRKCLQKLAYCAHKAQQQQADSKDTADISREQLLQAFDPMLEKLGREDLLGFLQQHTGILIAREQNHFAFPHRSFQEYLAMGWLTEQNDDLLSPEVCEDPLWWREVFLLAVVAQRQNPRFAVSYVRDLLEQGKTCADEIRYPLAVLSGLALTELDRKGSDELMYTVQQGLVTLIEDAEALNVNERAEAGRVLGRIGDPRPGIGVTANGLPDIEWLLIPEGEVRLKDNAGPFPVKAFYLARYPVTNAQFQSFLDDPKGYGNPQWWAKLDVEAGEPAMPGWQEANHPRETVSWFEAMAFCAWLSDRLGHEVTLPTEEQWQKAACSGQTEYDFPWGRNYEIGYANIDETWRDAGPHKIGRTTAVGSYPQGNSLQGVSDLSGNVWEWCLNTYENPDETQSSGAFRRVVRGGSWILNRDSARVSSRRYDSPDDRYDHLGFRVCCLSPI